MHAFAIEFFYSWSYVECSGVVAWIVNTTFHNQHCHIRKQLRGNHFIKQNPKKKKRKKKKRKRLQTIPSAPSALPLSLIPPQEYKNYL